MPIWCDIARGAAGTCLDVGVLLPKAQKAQKVHVSMELFLMAFTISLE